MVAEPRKGLCWSTSSPRRACSSRPGFLIGRILLLGLISNPLVLAEQVKFVEHKAHQTAKFRYRHFHVYKLLLGERSPVEIKKVNCSKPEVVFLEDPHKVEVQVPQTWRLLQFDLFEEFEKEQDLRKRFRVFWRE